MPPEIVPVILAGGKGSRLYPWSHPDKPKPFLKLPGHPYSLLQETLLRAQTFSAPVVTCQAIHRDLALSQMNACGVKAANLLLEPCSRNTAPAIAAVTALYEKEDPFLLVMPSDHAISDFQKLREAVFEVASLARSGEIITFGIVPHGPSSRYGYIRTGSPINDRIFDVSAFIEKPPTVQARRMIDEGGYLWNSGLFLFSASAMAEIMKIHAAAIWQGAYKALAGGRRLNESIFLQDDAFSVLPPVSFDRAVLEKEVSKIVRPVAMRWRDLGTWPSLLGYLCGWRGLPD